MLFLQTKHSISHREKPLEGIFVNLRGHILCNILLNILGYFQCLNFTENSKLFFLILIFKRQRIYHNSKN